jgi:hypothetical protein
MHDAIDILQQYSKHVIKLYRDLFAQEVFAELVFTALIFQILYCIYEIAIHCRVFILD